MFCFPSFRSLAAGLSVLAAAGASLAPAPARADPFAPIWTGVYAGFHAGANWADVDFNNVASADTSAFTGGGHLGLNMGFGNLIAGVEGDLNYDDASFGYTTVGGASGNLDVDWNASLRGRLGMPVGPALLYATAGFAWKEMTVIETNLTGASASNSQLLTGVVYGIGAEAFVLPNLSLRLEALHYDYGSEELSVGGAAAALQEVDPSDTVVRAGVTFHLN